MRAADSERSGGTRYDDGEDAGRACTRSDNTRADSRNRSARHVSHHGIKRADRHGSSADRAERSTRTD